MRDKYIVIIPSNTTNFIEFNFYSIEVVISNIICKLAAALLFLR